MKRSIIYLGLVLSYNAMAYELPSFIDPADIEDAKLECINQPVSYSDTEQKYVDMLWQETLEYIEGYAIGLTHGNSNSCTNSALSITETNTPDMHGPHHECIMSNLDMQRMVKEIYQVLGNKDQAKQCFSARVGKEGLYTPDTKFMDASPVAKWLNRPSLKSYYQTVGDEMLSKSGIRFSEDFFDSVTGDEMQMPDSFAKDISANKLPNLWGAVGWVPMYSKQDHRSLVAGSPYFRGGYAYAEVFGPWGLLQIAKINGAKVEAEIGMTVQALDTFYPYHLHIAQENYTTIRTPRCENKINQFIVSTENGVLEKLSEEEGYSVFKFDGMNTPNVDHYWASTTPSRDPIIYIPSNSIHAFDLSEECDLEKEPAAHVAVWARSTVPSYGGTTLCELQDASLPKDAINRREATVTCKPMHKLFK